MLDDVRGTRFVGDWTGPLGQALLERLPHPAEKSAPPRLDFRREQAQGGDITSRFRTVGAGG
ncbi:hypothetical protein GCM10007888_35210 [Methylobacterium oxalidis]|uniref:Uncharacterized protein n=1 Tax=Methylobacterium oxalidis TaxID=944322 RepID=A0ABQ6DLZ9_9HYPH|nr:hypothetical protein GCM10007888_35210 [Methylobacterium oxalidis]